VQTTSILGLTRFVPLKMKRRGVETRIIIAGVNKPPRKVDSALLKAVARARLVVGPCDLSAQEAATALSSSQQSAAKSALCSAIASKFPNPAAAGPSALSDPVCSRPPPRRSRAARTFRSPVLRT